MVHKLTNRKYIKTVCTILLLVVVDRKKESKNCKRNKKNPFKRKTLKLLIAAINSNTTTTSLLGRLIEAYIVSDNGKDLHLVFVDGLRDPGKARNVRFLKTAE